MMGVTDYRIFGNSFIAWQEITAVDIAIMSCGHGMMPYWIIKRKDKNEYKMQMPKNTTNFKIFAEALTMRAPYAKLSNKVIKLSVGKSVSLFLIKDHPT